MSKQVVRIAVAAAAATLFSSAALADSMDMEVKASVTGTCLMASAPALDFGALDPVAAPAVTGKTTTIQYLCTKGKTPASLTIDGDASGNMTRSMVHATVTTDKIPFTLKWGTSLPAGKGMGTGNEVSVTVTGDIAASIYQNLSTGDYAVTLPVVVTP